MAGRPPSAGFAAARLELHTAVLGERFGRIYGAGYPDPLGYGKAKSRFSDPRRWVAANRFGVLYLGQTLKVCFLEAVLRDQCDGVIGDLPMAERELTSRLYAEIEVVTPLRLIDLRKDRAVIMGVPSDVHRGTQHILGRAWSLAFHEHPSRPDGIIYPSRLNGHVNLAVYGRAVPKLRPVRIRPLLGMPELATVLDDFHIALVEPDPAETKDA